MELKFVCTTSHLLGWQTSKKKKNGISDGEDTEKLDPHALLVGM